VLVERDGGEEFGALTPSVEVCVEAEEEED